MTTLLIRVMEPKPLIGAMALTVTYKTLAQSQRKPTAYKGLFSINL